MIKQALGIETKRMNFHHWQQIIIATLLSTKTTQHTDRY